MVALEHVDATQRRFVWLASVSYRAGRGLLEQNDDAQDLMVGTPRMGEILRHIGWEATAGTAWAFIAWRVLPASGALEEPHGNLRLIAASAAQPCEMRRDGDRHRSTNLSYVVDENWRGRGLGWLAVSAAFGRLAEAQLQNYGERGSNAAAEFHRARPSPLGQRGQRRACGLARATARAARRLHRAPHGAS